MSLSEKPEVKQRKRSKCNVCHSPEYLAAMRLCSRCEAYVDQDNVGRPESLINGELLEAVSAEHADNTLLEFDASFEILPAPFTDPYHDNQPDFDELISGKLTRCQERVVELYVRQGLSFASIAQNLGVSRQAARIHYLRAIERLRKRLSKNGLVKGAKGKRI